jgi:hypothetical protein
MNDRNDRSRGIEILMTDDFEINPVDPLSLPNNYHEPNDIDPIPPSVVH